ncbi:unnamed protein product [Lymnaea stagnalis]|uniref:GNAT family N-acetyltransferase n=1 Tax=Lymnaea stagnalis TaxID=6523 RepID=A0AAV2HW73_LYMST
MAEPLSFPLEMTLPDGTQVTVRLMSDTEKIWLYSNLNTSIDTGFGAIDFRLVDQFRTSLELTGKREAEFLHYMAPAPKYVLERKSDASAMAYILLGKTRFYRGLKQTDPVIVTQFKSLEFDAFCFDLVQSLAKRHGFVGMYVDVFTSNAKLLELIESCEGFQQVAEMPGRTYDGREVTSKVFYKHLADENFRVTQ